MTPSLITTKLMVPRPPQTVVERPRLQALLAAGLKRKLILVSAPAGSGKSTLLANWLWHGDKPVAWLSLDAADNDMERFFIYFVQAFQQLDPTLKVDVQEVLQNQQSIQAKTVITRLINSFNRLNNNQILVLDDYHVISNPQIHQAVEFLLDYLPDQICLVIATRSDPPLALSRLRVRREIIEIRSDQLRFSREETATLLNDHLHLDLSPQALGKLEQRTEGWAAGLQLAALSLDGRSDKESFVTQFAGDHHYLVDYLLDEVMHRQTPEVRTFLQCTSILDRFTASLCQTVTEHKDSAAILKQLTRANLFLIPLDDERKWFRYHQLFAEFLRLHLEDSEAHMIPELHQRASRWFEQEGWTDEAIHHALQASDFQRAGHLVEAMAFNLGVSWNNAQLIKYVERLPLEFLPEFPRLCIYYGWALINTGRVEALHALLPVIERSNNRVPSSRALAAAALNFRACQFSWRLEFSRAIALCQEALDLLECEEPSYTDEDRWLRVTSTNLMAYNYLQSDIPKADSFYPAAFSLAQRFTNFAATANKFGRHGRVKHQLGQLHQAMEVFNDGLAAIERWKLSGGKPVVNEGELHVSMARLLYELNRLDEAEKHLKIARQFNQRSQFPPLLALELETTARLHLATGRLERALEVLPQLDLMLSQAHPDNLLYRQLFGVISMNLRLSLASQKCALTESHVRKAAAWVKEQQLSPDDPFDYPREAQYLVLSRLLLVQGQASQAVRLLARLIRAAQAEGRMENLLRYQVLQALGYQSLNQKDQALTLLSQSLELGEVQGFCRIFVDEDPTLHALITQLSQRQASPYLNDLLAAFLTSSPKIPPRSLSGSDVQTKPQVILQEPLTEREQVILRLLVAGNSNKEIGKSLGLSPNTVKWYVKGLYEKLEVGSRLEAVSRARELGLL